MHVLVNLTEEQRLLLASRYGENTMQHLAETAIKECAEEESTFQSATQIVGTSPIGFAQEHKPFGALFAVSEDGTARTLLPQVETGTKLLAARKLVEKLQGCIEKMETHSSDSCFERGK